MGVAMEKWISDGMDGGIGPRHGDEGSEPGTENSSWTADSLGTKNLDPNAVSFYQNFPDYTFETDTDMYPASFHSPTRQPSKDNQKPNS